MLVNQNNRAAFILTGTLVCTLAFLVVCTALCPADPNGFDGTLDIGCTASSHTFVPVGMGLTAFFVLALVGSVHLSAFPAIPVGFLLSLFKPPRHQAEYFTACRRIIITSIQFHQARKLSQIFIEHFRADKPAYFENYSAVQTIGVLA